MKDINNITDNDKDLLFDTFIKGIDIADLPHKWLKDLKKEFYGSIIHRKPELMPYCIVVELIELGYELN